MVCLLVSGNGKSQRINEYIYHSLGFLLSLNGYLNDIGLELPRIKNMHLVYLDGLAGNNTV